jgi:hypothetical protein
MAKSPETTFVQFVPRQLGIAQQLVSGRYSQPVAVASSTHPPARQIRKNRAAVPVRAAAIQCGLISSPTGHGTAVDEV